ncbi:MAG: DUF2961 domain-containing protein, partial [Candidatus Hydrogenedentes bacterium]|nr:DUF2961 domain-containing protein [Candidatus Hydrogenedentota bacterium]
DFFCAILGHMAKFENEFFSNPEGRSFNCYVPMPFRTGARITLTNESGRNLEKLFYDIDFTIEPAQPEAALYFHATWRRERWTELRKDFEILSRVTGSGRFLGANIGVITHPDNAGWWGEGEVKMYLDGDGEFPTIVGTGTEDYIGTGWGQGEYAHRYQGCLQADGKAGHFSFYRYHVPDPVYFHQDIRVTIQQMGGAGKKQVLELLEKNVPVVPVSVNPDNAFIPLLDPPRDLKDQSIPDGWTNMYRQDDFSAVAYFYLNRAENGLPELASVAKRVEGL